MAFTDPEPLSVGIISVRSRLTQSEAHQNVLDSRDQIQNALDKSVDADAPDRLVKLVNKTVSLASSATTLSDVTLKPLYTRVPKALQAKMAQAFVDLKINEVAAEKLANSLMDIEQDAPKLSDFSERPQYVIPNAISAKDYQKVTDRYIEAFDTINKGKVFHEFVAEKSNEYDSNLKHYNQEWLDVRKARSPDHLSPGWENKTVNYQVGNKKFTVKEKMARQQVIVKSIQKDNGTMNEITESYQNNSQYVIDMINKQFTK